jgi:hypothetical protein
VFITNHVLAGAVIGLVTPRRRPLAAMTIGVASHFALDAVPHWGADHDRRLFLRAAVTDGLCGLAACALVTRAVPSSRRVTVIAAMLGACLPDADKPALLFFGRSPFPPAVDQTHARIQRESPDHLLREVRVAGALAASVAVLATVTHAGRRGAAR